MANVNNNFDFFVPIDSLEKGTSEDGEEVWKIKGVASTESEDLQKDTVVQKGLELDYFLNYGYFNDDHRRGIEFKVGEPTKAELTNNGLYVEGILYKHKKSAQNIWEHMNAQQKEPNSRRKMGFSIQGKVKERRGRQITKAWIKDIAITPCPVNTHTWADIVKSFYDEDTVEDDRSYEERNEDAFEKAMEAGYATTNQTGGSAMRKEDLNAKIKNDKMSKSQVADYLQGKLGWSEDTSLRVAEYMFAQQNN